MGRAALVLQREPVGELARARPDWVVVPPKGLNIVATDNNAKLREMWFDPLVQKSNRIDSVYGVVSIMEEADQKIDQHPRAQCRH